MTGLLFILVLKGKRACGRESVGDIVDLHSLLTLFWHCSSLAVCCIVLIVSLLNYILSILDSCIYSEEVWESQVLNWRGEIMQYILGWAGAAWPLKP